MTICKNSASDSGMSFKLQEARAKLLNEEKEEEEQGKQSFTGFVVEKIQTNMLPDKLSPQHWK